MKFCIRLLFLITLVFAVTAQASDTRPTPYLGVDLSYVNEMEDCGGEYRVNGELTDPYALFSDAGANLVRVRLWHSPDWTNYSTLADVKRSLARAKAHDIDVLLDVHYSDTWADPSKQIIPAAWVEFVEDDEALAQAVYEYTRTVLTELDQEGLLPNIVQVGNEINSEMLRGENESGYPINWDRNARLINAGIRAVRESGPQVMLHIAQPDNVEGWLLAATRAGVTDFDIIGISYYTGWSDYTLNGVGKIINKLYHRFGKEILIVETAYPWTLSGVNESAGNSVGADFVLEDYPATPAGQNQYMHDLTQTVLSNGGLGTVYWEPAWISTSCHTLWGQGSHRENATFFDFRDQNNAHEGITYLSADYALPVEITLEVSFEAIDSDGAYFWGDFTGVGRRLLPMRQIDDRTYAITTRLMPGRVITFAFFTGSNRTDDQEVLDTTCADVEGSRTWTVPDSDTHVKYTFGQCEG